MMVLLKIYLLLSHSEEHRRLNGQEYRNHVHCEHSTQVKSFKKPPPFQDVSDECDLPCELSERIYYHNTSKKKDAYFHTDMPDVSIMNGDGGKLSHSLHTYEDSHHCFERVGIAEKSSNLLKQNEQYQLNF